MAQVFTPLRTIAATGVGAITVAAIGRRTVWADELKAPALKKLSIYDSEEPEILVTQTESELVETIGQTRRILARAGEESKDGIQGVIASWIRVERRVESRIRSLISPEEPLTPGILYVGVAALSGSVFARGRSLPTRVLLPPTLFFGALNYFLPKTTHNVNAYVYGLERAHAPALADTHDAAGKTLRDAVKQIRASYNSMRGGVSHIVEDSVDGLESTTGLKLRDATIGRAQQVSEATQDKASSIAHNIQEKTAELQKRAVAIAEDVQSRLGQSESQKPGAPAGLLAKPKEPEAPLERVKEKVEEAVNKVSNDAKGGETKRLV
ncbi:apolipoprotein O [Rhizoctonia solani AG-3 Rhs1AP]|uniref:MICOS complex subunit n=1 Tax=Rhizoctonia solani AG-3 Rhs1AP TaxID=1086054 RepID=X8JHX0_9AGAM|nr:apolipoprotein O [Rhizoctonia solani AG-3 Rhs1AP]